MKIAFIIYRAWAFDIFKALMSFQNEYPYFDVPLLITTPEREFDINRLTLQTKIQVLKGNDQEGIEKALSDHGVDVAFFFGWSWLVKEPTLSRRLCMCLHPSALPRYRGGSPIQHQVIAGEKESKVTLFKIGEGIDDGDIYKQTPISLEGTINDIFGEITRAGILLSQSFICDFCEDSLSFIPQENLEANPPYRRRTKSESEIPWGSVGKLSFQDFYNKVRALADPYPNAYFPVGGNVLLIKEVSFTQEPEGILLAPSLPMGTLTGPLYLKLLDGYAQIGKYEVIQHTHD